MKDYVASCQLIRVVNVFARSFCCVLELKKTYNDLALSSSSIFPRICAKMGTRFSVQHQ